MISTDPLRSILYRQNGRPPLAVPAVLLWVLALFMVPLLPLFYFLVLRPRQWFLAPPLATGLTSADLLAALAGSVALGVALGLTWLLRAHLQFERLREAETLAAAAETADATSLQWWDRALKVGAPAVMLLLFAAGQAGVLELLLAFGIAGGVAVGSRRLSRFPQEAEADRIPYSAGELKVMEDEASAAGSKLVEYAWRFREHGPVPGSAEKLFRFTTPFEEQRYQEALKKPHTVRVVEDYARFVREDFTCPELVWVAAKLKEINAAERYTPFQQVGNVLAFLRQFDYAHDIDTRGVEEYPRYPVETLWDREGDCECHAILAAALLTLLGFDVVLLVLDFASGPGHAALGVAGADDLPAALQFYELGGRRYFYCEATPPSTVGESREWRWSIGVMPFEDPARVTPLPVTQILTAQ